MARLRLGVVALAALLLVAAVTSSAGAADRGPRFSATIGHELPDDPVRIVAGDLNGDGSADLASVNWNSSSVSVLFREVTGTSPSASTSGRRDTPPPSRSRTSTGTDSPI